MKKILTDKRVIVVAGVIILILLLMDFNQRMVLLLKLRGQEEQLATEYTQLQATQLALQTEIAYADSVEAVERWAREQAGMIQEGDTPIILLPPEGITPTSTVPQPTQAEPIENWEVWQELFFGN
jgi:cell division protein FtsB